MNHIAFDAHKRYTSASVERAEGGILREVRVGRERGAIRTLPEYPHAARTAKI